MNTLALRTQPATKADRKTRKEATPEQKEAALIRRQGIKNLCALVKALPIEKRVLLADSYGIRNPEGRELSPFNQCLLVHQNSSVSIVGGFSQWKKLGRSVKKGERALAIWVPCAKQAEGAGDAGADPDTGEDRFFILGNVFDITQTETDDEKAARVACDTLALPAPPLALPEHAEAYDIAAEPFTVPTWQQAPEREGWTETTGRDKASRIIWRKGLLFATYDDAADSMDIMPDDLTIWDVIEPAPGQPLLMTPKKKAKPAPVVPDQAEFFDLCA